MSSQSDNTTQLSEGMQILIADLQAVRSKENGQHVDRMIQAAQREYYNEDYIAPLTGSPTPAVDLVAHLTRLELSTLLANALDGKYDNPRSNEL